MSTTAAYAKVPASAQIRHPQTPALPDLRPGQGHLPKFEMCRLCLLRTGAQRGEIPGVIKLG